MIGISGFGFVGSAIYSNIKDKNKVKIYDPGFTEFNDKNELLKCDTVFICVGTPLKNGEMDASAVLDNLLFLKGNKYNGLIVIKSTIHPDYIPKSSLKGLDVLSNPEFLDEHSAFDDFKNQKLIIIGGRIDLCNKLKCVYDEYFDLDAKFEFVKFEEALIFKYIRNIKIAYDVMFWEFVNETTGNYRKYKKILDKIPFTIKNIRSDGLPGFGGHCLPKDTTSYPNSILTKYLLDYNKSVRKSFI
jgi:UDP-glucose 6-dehydrogenase